MAFPRTSSIVLWFSLILFVYWTTSAAQSHDPSPADLSALRRLKRALDGTTKEQIQSGFRLGLDFLTTVTQVTKEIDDKKLSTVFKGLANFANLAPGIGSLVGSFISVVLAFIPQESDLDRLRNSFSEVNRRLDSLAFQISDLATDVEWFNFVSVYSPDEIRILNAWRKLDEFHQNLRVLTSEEDKLRLAEIFAKFYENSGTEGSVASIYHLLTISGTSLSRNINSLLRDKFKCSIKEIGRFNLYLSSLLWKGMVLNQLYWKLIGFSALGKQDEHNRMFKDVLKAQNNSLQFCLDNYQQYMLKDVEVVSTRFTTDRKQDIADAVRKTLDEKYFWYKWAVVVYDKYYEDNYKQVYMWVVTVGDLVVAVGYIKKDPNPYQQEVESALQRCFAGTQCSDLKSKSKNCVVEGRYITGDTDQRRLSKFAKILHYFYYYDPVMSPPPQFNQVECTLDGYQYKVKVYMSRTLSVCSSRDTCRNGGKCRRLLYSSEYLCDCPDGYYGDRCEKSTSIYQNNDISFRVPDMTTLNTKLDQILRTHPAH
ncbi:uncharacterized protein LOC115436019 [Sphaeramia orbicularis]|nr:uncharacterized protein LOC115436019 [Sphaeramia orbicularis]